MSVADRVRAAQSGESTPAAPAAEVVETPSGKKELPPSTPPGSAQEYEFSDSELNDFLSEDDGEDDTGIPAAETPPDEVEDDGLTDEEPVETILPGSEEIDQGTPPAGEEAETTPPTEETTPPVQAAAPTPPVPPVEQQGQPEAGQQQEAPKQKTAEELQVEYDNARQVLEESLMQQYALSEDDASALITEPEVVFPRLMARLHTNVLASMAQGMAQQLPSMIQHLNQQQEAMNAYNTAFYSKWGELKGHEDVVNRFSQMYQQLNPQATMEQAIDEIGAQVMVALRKPIKGQPQPVPDGGQSQVTAPVTPPPPVPASVGGSAPPKPAPAGQGNIFSEMAEEFLADGDM